MTDPRSSDRNWLEFLSVIDGTFHQASGGDESSSPEGSSSSEISDRVSKSQKFFERIAEKDGRRDRSGLLALLELERRVRLDELATGRNHFGAQENTDLTQPLHRSRSDGHSVATIL